MCRLKIRSPRRRRSAGASQSRWIRSPAPGAMVSGHVTFSDGKTADWYIDQTGRFGLVPPEPGYRPSQADLAEFQAILDRELAKIGY